VRVLELGGGGTIPFRARQSRFALAFKAAAEPDGHAVIGLAHGDSLDELELIALTPEMAAKLHIILGQALDQPLPQRQDPGTADPS
jgi:hypothetical protein